MTSVVFGLLHFYQGTGGVVLTPFASLVHWLPHLASGRNLWASVMARGTTDALSFLLLYARVWECSA